MVLGSSTILTSHWFWHRLSVNQYSWYMHHDQRLSKPKKTPKLNKKTLRKRSITKISLGLLVKKLTYTNKITSKLFFPKYKRATNNSLPCTTCFRDATNRKKTKQKQKQQHCLYELNSRHIKFHPFCWQDLTKEKYWIFTFFFCQLFTWTTF